MQSLRISVQVSVQEINESDPVSMQIFFLLGQLPGGIFFKDLEKIWIQIQQTKISKKNKLKRIMSVESSAPASNQSNLNETEV